MSKGVRWSVDELDAFRQRQKREDIRHPRPAPPIAGEANAQDKVVQAHAEEQPTLSPGIPVLTDAVAGPGARKKKPRKTKRPEERPYYQALCQLLPPGIPPPVPEYRFDPKRLWRLDFAWPDRQIGLEVDGALFVNGAHNRGAALLRQYEKSNAAQMAGWVVLRYGTTHAQLVQAARDVAKVFGK